MRKNNWEQVSVIAVDAGLCWLGDPCYIMGNDASHKVESWDEFCAELERKEKNGVSQWYYAAGRPGLGTSVSTGYGDGVYPVYVKRTRTGYIAEVKVVFIKENEYDEENN